MLECRIFVTCVCRTRISEEEDSLLTNLKTASTDTDPSQPSPVMKELVKCMKYLIGKNEG